MSTKTFPSSVPPDDDFEVVADDDFEVVDDQAAEPEPDVYKLAKERREAKNLLRQLGRYGTRRGESGGMDGEQTKKRLAEIDETLKGAGYDPNEIEREFWDMPSIKGFTGKQAMALKAENPLFFERKKAAIKSQYALSEALSKKLGASAANDYMNAYYQGQVVNDYESQRRAAKEAMSAVHTYIDDEDEQRKIKAELIHDKAYGYGVGLPGQEEAIKNDPRAELMNPYQVTAIQFLEDVDPPTAQAFNRLLAFTPEELEAQKGNVSFMRGWEKKSRELENIGMNLQRKALEEKMTSMLRTKDNWTPEQKADYQKSYETYETLVNDMNTQQDRYPAMANLDADAIMQEAMGPTKGLAEQTILGIGENVDDAANWIGDLIKAPFLNDKEEAGEDLELMGDKERTRLDQYETADMQLFTPENSIVFKGPLKRKLDKIKADDSLSDEEKRQQGKDAILADRRQNVEFIANDAAGKVNFTGKSFLGAVSNIVSEIAPQIAIAYLSGGAANASKVGEMTSLFGSTFATAYRDNYNSALEQNVANPSQYALTHTIIEAASELLNNDLEMAKNLFKGKAAAKALSGITKQEMAAIGRAGTGRFAKVLEAMGKAAKGSAINAYKEGAEEVAGGFGMNIADKVAFNQDVSMGEGLVQDFVTTFVGMLPLGLLGLPAQYNQVNKVQQYALYEAAMNPEKFNAKVDKDLAAGVISEGEATKRKQTIARASAAVNEMKTTRPDGTELTDNQKAKYVLNTIALEDIEKQTKNADPELKAELETQAELIENEQKKIMQTEPQEPARKEIKANRKKELAQAKKEYAEYDADFREEQMDLINEKYDDQLKELEKREKEQEKEAAKAAKEETKKKAEPVEPAIPTEEKPIEAPQEIETEEDLEKELTRVLSEPQDSLKLDKQADSTEVNPTVKEATAEQYLGRAKAVLGELFPGIAVTAYDTSEEYYAKEQRPKGSAGVFDPKSGRIAYNLPLIQKANAENTIFHEAIHPIVNEVIGKDKTALDSLYTSLKEMEDIVALAPVFTHALAYKDRGENIMKAEAVTEFLTLVADGKLDTSSLSEKAINKIIDLINKILEAIGSTKRLENVADLKRLSESVKLAFTGQGTEQLAGIIGKKQNDPTGQKLDALINNQEDAVKDIIRRTSKNISDERLLNILQKSTGLPAPILQNWINEVRNLPPTPQAPTPTSQLTPNQRQMALNKMNRLFRKEYPKGDPWHKRAWDYLKNISHLLDNPYRFVTKIVEDINKNYKLKDEEVIPLGRAFEKSAAGKAALAVDRFVQAVVYGRIGDQKLGQIKGKKFDDFQKYLAAKRVIDRLDTQEKKRAKREDVSRATGNITKQDAQIFLEELKPEDVKDFEQRAKAFQDHMDLMLQELVAAGNISQEAYKKIKEENDFYAPFSVVRQQVLADMKQAPVGIAGVVKRIKGIGYELPSVSSKGPLALMNDLADALNKGQISAEEYFNSSLDVLDNALAAGQIKQEEYNSMVADLENPGFEINGMIDAAANMIYRAQGMALKNTMMQRLYAYKEKDTEGLFIQDVDGMTPMQFGGETVMVPKPLNTIPVKSGMAPVRLRFQGKDKVVAINKYAADKLNGMSNFEMPALMMFSDWINRVFRTAVITLSPGFQAVNFVIDFVRASMLSRYGAIAGKGLVQPIVNAVLYPLQYIEALGHSALGNVGIKTETYKQWMESESFSKGMFDNLFDNEKRFKPITVSRAKRVLSNFLKLKFIDIPGSILEQTHKLAIYERGMAVEGLKPEMFTAMLSSLFNQHISDNMTQQQLSDAVDRLNYEVQNYAGSPNFPQTHPWLKLASLFLQFFSARVKGEMTDYRRVANLFSGTGEGVKLSAQERTQMILQFSSIASAIAAYALANNADDEDEAEFNSIPAYHQDNYLNIPAGNFEYKDSEGNVTTRRDYMKMPLRGLTASMNVIANKFVKWRKHQDPTSLKEMALGVMGNASPMNLHGKDEHELGESAVSNMTPVFKYFFEFSFNRDTHSHRDIIPDTHGKRSMFSRYRAGDLKPWLVRNPKTPAWCSKFSRFLYEELDWSVSAATIEHLEKTMGNPTEMYNNAIEKRLIRSEMKYPVAGSTPWDEYLKQQEIINEVYNQDEVQDK